MMVSELLDRARSMTGRRVIYKLGGGGMSPSAPSPANMRNECDCSGYVCWCLGRSRQTSHPLYVRFNGGWINTDAMVHDAVRPAGFFEKLAEPRPGCIVVYASRPPGQKVGLVGLVTEVRAVAGGPARVAHVVHCSHGNYRGVGDAICETAPTAFQKPDAIYAWYEGVD